MKQINKKIIKYLFLFAILIVFVQCNLAFLKPASDILIGGGTSSYKYSIYNPDGNAHIASSYYTSYPVTITSKYLFNKDYIWFATIANIRYVYQFKTFYGEPQVYSAYASSILKYERWQIYEDRKLMPTTIYTNTVGEWFMSFSPIFYEYKNEYLMNNDFDYRGASKSNATIFTNIRPGLNQLALKNQPDYLRVIETNRGALINAYLSIPDIERKVENTSWYAVNMVAVTNKVGGKIVVTTNASRANGYSYELLPNRELKEVIGISGDLSSATKSISKGWSVWQKPEKEFKAYLNYVYIYDIKNIKIFLNYPANTDFSTITVNTNLDVLMLWYDPNNPAIPSAGPFTRYTVDKD